jgi:hypothetical protein
LRSALESSETRAIAPCLVCELDGIGFESFTPAGSLSFVKPLHDVLPLDA